MYYVIEADHYCPDFRPPKGCMLGLWDGASGIIVSNGPFTAADLDGPQVVSVHDTMLTAQIELELNRGTLG